MALKRMLAMDKLNEILKYVVGGIVIAAVVMLGKPQPKPVNDSWFQNAVLKNSRPVVVKFGAEWCGPCRSMDEALSQLKAKHPGAAFLTIDIDKRPDLFSHYSSGGGIPQVMIFDHGNIIASQRGFGGTEQLDAWLHQNL